jgi:hypothetical protein
VGLSSEQESAQQNQNTQRDQNVPKVAEAPDKKDLTNKDEDANDKNKKERWAALQKVLVETLQKQVNGLEARLMAGKDLLITVLEALENLTEAQLALATDKMSRVQVVESYVQRLLGYEAIWKARLEFGSADKSEVAQIRAKRLMAEILLEKEKGR